MEKGGELFLVTCDQYPIVASILYLKKDTGLLNKKVVKLILNKKYYQATKILIFDSFVVKHLLSIFLKFNFNNNFFMYILRFVLRYFSKHKSWIRYIQNRSNNSRDFIVLNSILQKNIKSEETIIDIGCGNSFLKQHLPTDIKYIGIDYDFLSLLLGSFKNVENEDILICSDVNIGLLLLSNVANHIIYLDSLAYIYKKFFLLEESIRVLEYGYVYFIGLYDSNTLTDQWGYGISEKVLVNYIKKLSIKFASFKSEKWSLINNKDKKFFYSVILKK